MNDTYGEPWSPRRMTRRETIFAMTAALLTALGTAAIGENALAKRTRRKHRSSTKNKNNSDARSTGQGGAGGDGGDVIVGCPPVCIGP
jgi:hypothetical protein